MSPDKCLHASTNSQQIFFPLRKGEKKEKKKKKKEGKEKKKENNSGRQEIEVL